MNTTAAVVVGTSKTIHLATGTLQADGYRLATETLACGTAPIARSWEAATAATKGLRVIKWAPTCRKCIAAK